MKIGINNRYQIKQVGEITDATLVQLELDENSELYPFKGWTDEKILCYCYKNDGDSISVYPYVDTNKISEFEYQALNLQAKVIELEFEKIGGTVI